MLKESMEKALNKQINAEFYSAYLYLSMSCYFEANNWKGFAHWMRAQFREEQEHAMKLYHYVFEKGGTVTLSAIDNPQSKWDSPLKIFEEVYAHEQKVTTMINNLVDMAIADKDHATNNYLQWFVAEQVEEEANASEILEKLKLIKDSPQALFMLDAQLGQRK